MADALVLPVFDGGNQGIRRRQVQEIFGREAYQPWAATFGAEAADEKRNGVHQTYGEGGSTVQKGMDSG